MESSIGKVVVAATEIPGSSIRHVLLDVLGPFCFDLLLFLFVTLVALSPF